MWVVGWRDRPVDSVQVGVSGVAGACRVLKSTGGVPQ